MKFSGKSDRHANIRAWHEHKRTNRHHQTPYQALSRPEKDWLMKLNTQLAKLEAHYYAVLRDKANALRARVLNDDDWLQDFNLSLVLTFHLREDDPEYEACDENVLTEIEIFFFDATEADHDYGFGLTNIHHCERLENHPGEHHCYLFHQLAEHSGVDWRDLLRIGEIWIDLKIDEQSGFLIAPEKT